MSRRMGVVLGSVVSLDDYREHFTVLDLDGKVHVIPGSFFDAIVEGRCNIEELDGWQKIVPIIIDEWLEFVRREVG